MTPTNHNPPDSAQALADSAYFVRVRKGGREYSFHDLTKSVTRIGARDDNDIPLEEEAPNTIAPYHAQILLNEQGVQIRALARLLRTNLNDRKLTPFKEEKWSSLGDGASQIVHIGPYSLELLNRVGIASIPQARPGPKSPAPAAPGFDGVPPGEIGITSASAGPLYLSPGHPAAYALHLHNRTAARQTLRIEVHAEPRIPQDWIRYPAELSIGAGRSSPIDLDIDVPPLSSSAPRRYRVTIKASARDDEATTSSVATQWIVLPFVAPPQLEVKPRKRRSGATIYDVAVTNATNIFASYTLAAGDDDSALDCSFQQEYLGLEAGRTATVDLRVSLKPAFAADRNMRLFVVELTPQGQDSVRRIVQFVPSRSLMPSVPRTALLWLAAALALVLVVVAVNLLLESARRATAQTQAAVQATVNVQVQQQVGTLNSQLQHQAETLVATQEAIVKTEIYSTATTIALALAPIQTSGTDLNASRTTVSIRETNSANTVVVIAADASAAAIQASTDQAAAAQATVAFAQQVANQSGTVVAGGQTAAALAAAPGQTVIAQATVQAISAQNATAAQAAANQANIAQTSQSAGQTAVVEATKQANETKPVKLRFDDRAMHTTIKTGQSIGSVLVELLDSQGRISRRSGITIQLVLVGKNGVLEGAAAANTTNGVAIFNNLRIRLDSNRPKEQFVLEASAVLDGVLKAQSRSITVYNT